MTLPRINVTSLAQIAYDLLKERILIKELAPGQRLDLDEISHQLGISKTPLKRALQRLELEGLVEIQPRSGTFVTDINPQEVTESFELRKVLELYAVERVVSAGPAVDLSQLRAIVEELHNLAVQPQNESIYPQYLALDHEFHRRLVHLADNDRLIKAHENENVHALMARIRYRSTARDLLTSLHEHEEILAALEAQNLPQARFALDKHLSRAKEMLLADMSRDSAQE